MLEQLVWMIVYILIAAAVGGLLTWLVRTAPFLPAELKPYIVWGIWAVVAIAVIFALLGLARGGRTISIGAAPAIESVG